jgi:hypothetical protein
MIVLLQLKDLDQEKRFKNTCQLKKRELLDV